MSKKYSSPDKQHRVALVYEGEIRFGPAYYRIEIDGWQLPDKLCGEKLFWSPDSRYLALEEWLTTQESEGPVTRLLLVDLATMKAAAFETLEGGFLENVRFLDGGVFYVKRFPATGKGSETEVDYSHISNWSSFGLHPSTTRE